MCSICDWHDKSSARRVELVFRHPDMSDNRVIALRDGQTRWSVGTGPYPELARDRSESAIGGLRSMPLPRITVTANKRFFAMHAIAPSRPPSPPARRRTFRRQAYERNTHCFPSNSQRTGICGRAITKNFFSARPTFLGGPHRASRRPAITMRPTARVWRRRRCASDRQITQPAADIHRTTTARRCPISPVRSAPEYQQGKSSAR